MIIPRLLEQCLLVILLFAFRSSSNTFHPFSRLDVMGNYTVVNIHQCGRLCWYRQLCDFYSFNQNTSTAGAEINCVLHTGQNYATERKDGWVQRPATGTDVTNGCATRPCSQTEVCVPAPSNYQCLPVPSRCKQPGNVTDADVIVTGTSQDDVAIVRCREGLSVIPHNAVTELRCQVTSQWTTFDGTCVKAEYLFDPPENKFVGSLPSMIAPNWVMCVKGVFTDEGQLYLNLQPDVDNSHDVTFHFALKYQFKNEIYDVRWNTKLNGTFQNASVLGGMPLVPGDTFAFTIRALNDSLRVILHGHETYDIPLEHRINLSEVRYFMIGGQVDTTYVNFAAGCETENES